MKLSRLEKADVPQVSFLEQACFSVPWSQASLYQDIVNNDLARYHGMFDDKGTLIAYMGYWKVLEQAHVTNVAVAPAWRRRGVGKRLFGYVLQKAAQEG